MIRYGLSKVFGSVTCFTPTQKSFRQLSLNNYRDEILTSLEIVLNRVGLKMEVIKRDTDGGAELRVKSAKSPDNDDAPSSFSTEWSDFLLYFGGCEAAVRIGNGGEYDVLEPHHEKTFYYGDSDKPEPSYSASNPVRDRQLKEINMRYKKDVEKIAAFVIEKSLHLLRPAWLSPYTSTAITI